MSWKLIKRQVKFRIFSFYRSTFFIFAGRFTGTAFVRVLFVVSIISSHVITELWIMLFTYLLFSKLHVTEYQIKPTLHTFLLDFCTHKTFIDIYRFSKFGLFLLSNLHLYLHDICFVNAFDSFALVIKLKTLKFTSSSVLFGTRILSNILLRVLQLPLHI